MVNVYRDFSRLRKLQYQLQYTGNFRVVSYHAVAVVGMKTCITAEVVAVPAELFSTRALEAGIHYDRKFVGASTRKAQPC